ncbi:PA14 domain protein [compost metagenome]
MLKEYASKSKKCAEIKNNKLVKESKVESMEMPKDFKGFAGLIFEGYFEVKADGVYTFELASNDGSMLYVDDAMVIDNDGPHGNKTKTGQKALAKGWHKMVAEYFDLDSGGNFSVKIKSTDDKGFTVMNQFKN